MKFKLKAHLPKKATPRPYVSDTEVHLDENPAEGHHPTIEVKIFTSTGNSTFLMNLEEAGQLSTQISNCINKNFKILEF